jgi:hypothetical protein
MKSKAFILILSSMLTAPSYAFFLPTRPKYAAIASIGPLIYTGYKTLRGSKKARGALKGIIAYLFATLAVDYSYQSNPSRYGIEPEIAAGICGLTSCALIESAYSDLYTESAQATNDISALEQKEIN